VSAAAGQDPFCINEMHFISSPLSDLFPEYPVMLGAKWHEVLLTLTSSYNNNRSSLEDENAIITGQKSI
jgi:hypothetical protein